MAPLADERGRRELLECSLGEPRAWLVALEARIEATERRQATMTEGLDLRSHVAIARGTFWSRGP